MWNCMFFFLLYHGELSISSLLFSCIHFFLCWWCSITDGTGKTKWTTEITRCVRVYLVKAFQNRLQCFRQCLITFRKIYSTQWLCYFLCFHFYFNGLSWSFMCLYGNPTTLFHYIAHHHCQSVSCMWVETLKVWVYAECVTNQNWNCIHLFFFPNKEYSRFIYIFISFRSYFIYSLHAHNFSSESCLYRFCFARSWMKYIFEAYRNLIC